MKTKKRFKKINYLYRAMKYRYIKDRYELRYLAQYIQPGNVVIDIGAHKGAYTYWMRKAATRTGKVIAFEPQPILYDYMKDCVRGMYWDNVSVENSALSSEPGEMSLHVPTDSPSPGATLDSDLGRDFEDSYNVSVDTLDNYAKKKNISNIDFIKCDVEGHELEVFKGAMEILSTNKPVLMFECEQRHNINRTITATFNYLRHLGYEGFFFLNGVMNNISTFSIEKYQKLDRKPYINNFLFINKNNNPIR